MALKLNCLNGIILSEPVRNLYIPVDGSFTITLYGIYIEGNCNSIGEAGDIGFGVGICSSNLLFHDFYFEWDQGTATWQQIPESDTEVGIYSIDQTDYTDKDGSLISYNIDNPISITIYGNIIGVYNIRGHGYRDGENYYSDTIQITILPVNIKPHTFKEEWTELNYEIIT